MMKPTRTSLSKLLAVFVGLEAIFLALGGGFFLQQVVLQKPKNISGAFVIVLIAFIIAITLFLFTVSLFKNKRTFQGAIITWQILQFAIATSFIRGTFFWPAIGLTLAALSVGVIVIYFLISRTENDAT